MRRTAPALLLSWVLCLGGCHLGQTPEERYVAKLERLKAKLKAVNDEIAELQRQEADRQRREWEAKTEKKEERSGWWSSLKK